MAEQLLTIIFSSFYGSAAEVPNLRNTEYFAAPTLSIVAVNTIIRDVLLSLSMYNYHLSWKNWKSTVEYIVISFMEFHAD